MELSGRLNEEAGQKNNTCGVHSKVLLIPLIKMPFRLNYVISNDRNSFFFLRLNIIPLCIYATFYLSIHPLIRLVK